MSVTPILCMTLAFWLGRGSVTCAIVATAQLKTNMMAKTETELRFRELMVFLLVDGFGEIIPPNGAIQYRTYMTYLTYNARASDILLHPHPGGLIACLAVFLS